MCSVEDCEVQEGRRRERKMEGEKGAQAVYKPQHGQREESQSTHLFFVGEQSLELSLFNFNI
jgi:hypothetical protein